MRNEFIEVTIIDGTKAIINVNTIQVLTPKNNGCEIYFVQGGTTKALVKETYEDLKKLIFE